MDLALVHQVCQLLRQMALLQRVLETMSILDPRRRPGRSVLVQLGEPSVLAEAHQFARMAREGYRLHSVVRACIDELVSSAAEPEFVVEQYVGKGKWETVDPLEGRGGDSAARALARLMRNPSKDLSRYSWMERLITEYSIYGNCFAEKVRTESGQVRYLEPLRVPWIQPERRTVGDTVRSITVRKYLDQQELVAKDEVRVKVEDLFHHKMIDPLDDWWGLPPMVSVLEDIDLDQKAHQYLRSFFYNAGTPQGLLKMKGVSNQDQRRSLQMQWRERYSGEDAHSLAVIDQDAEYQELGTRPDKLKLDHIFDVTESRICATYHVPPGLVAVRIGLMRNTFSNAKEQRRSFWHETLRPMYVKFGEDLTHHIALEFEKDGRLRIRADFSRVEDLQELIDSRRKWALEGYEKGLLSHHEARERAEDDLQSSGTDHFKTKSADGKPFEMGEKPEPNPKPLPAANPAARPAKPTRNAAAPPGEADPGAPPASNLRIVGDDA